MKGWKTLLLNTLIAGGVGALHFLGGQDLAEYMKPEYAVLGTAVLNFGLRFLTSTPVGKSA